MSNTIRTEFIGVVTMLRDEFPQSNISNMANSLLEKATAPDRPQSKWAVVCRRPQVLQGWDATVAIVDLRNTVALAHREGFIDNDGFKAFNVAIEEWKMDLRVEKVEDAFSILQKSLRRDARRLAKGL
jgi:hypothetical protein